MATDPPPFGALLKRHRLAAGLTQEALAERAGVSPRAVSALEGERARLPRLDSVALLAAALDLTPAEHRAFLAAARPLAATSDAARNLPAAPPSPTLRVPPTPLIGREGAVAATLALLRGDEGRMLTLTGPGGTGKSRLALQLADEARADFPDGVAFVALAALTDPATVTAAVAATLDVAERGDRPLLAGLRDALRGRQLLLVLDNFEQVLDAAPLVADLLGAAPQLRVLVTSRAPLLLAGEQQFPVPPLSLPDPAASPSPAEAVRSPAVRLFAARARAEQPAFAVTGDNVAAVVAICRRLDGLPLALELAAARLRVLSPPALLARLERRLTLLTGGAPDRPARHQTLRATIDWSHDLLAPAARALFARLAAFAGGATLDAIEAVCGDGGDGPDTVLDSLDALVRASLLRREEDDAGEPRFAMLETIREYATERLAASEEGETVRRVHAAHYLTLAEEAATAGRGPALGTWLDRLTREHDNLRAALGGILARGEVDAALRLVAALREFWQARGHLSEGRRWTGAALAAGAGAAPALRAPALLAAGWLAVTQGDWPAVEAAAGESERLCAARGDRQGEAAAHHLLGFVAQRRGDRAAAAACFAACLALWQELGDRRGLAAAHREIGYEALMAGELGAARAHLEEALALQRALGWQADLADTGHHLGLVAALAGDYRAASAHLRESVAVWRALGDRTRLPGTLSNLGLVEAWAGNLAATRPLLEEALTLRRAQGDRPGLILTLGVLAFVAREQGDDGQTWALLAEGLPLALALGDREMLPNGAEQLAGLLGARGADAEAARLYSAVAAWRESTAAPPRYRGFEPAYQRDLAAARAQLDDAAWSAAWDAGRVLPLAAAIAEALGPYARSIVAAPASGGTTRD